jgi:hypothetical protein
MVEGIHLKHELITQPTPLFAGAPFGLRYPLSHTLMRDLILGTDVVDLQLPQFLMVVHKQIIAQVG